MALEGLHTHGAGMPHRVLWRVRDADAPDFRSARLPSEGVETSRSDEGLRFADPEGLQHGLVAEDVPDAPGRGRQGAGAIHHVASSGADDIELERFRDIVAGAGARPTPIIDRRSVHSVHVREPGGVLFELASRGTGAAAGEPVASLGEELELPARCESRRAQLERALAPITTPRAPP